MKILIAGPDSVHVKNYVENIASCFPDANILYYLGEKEFELSGITKSYIIPFRFKNPFKLIRQFNALKKLIHTINPDIIHVHQINRLALFISFIAKKINIPSIATAWGSDILLVPKKSFLHKFIVKKTLRGFDAITGDSNQLISKIKNLSQKNKTILLAYYGIKPINSLPKEKIIYSNRLHEPNYRISNIILMFNEFVKTNPDWKLVIGGTGTLTDQLKRLVKQLNLDKNIEFIGWCNKNENNYWYSVASIYISIPESDGTSVSLMEAMSAGCIPIVSDIEVSYQWIENKINGIICSNNDMDCLNNAIALNQQEVAKLNKNKIDNTVSIDNAIKSFYAIYKNLVSKKN